MFSAYEFSGPRVIDAAGRTFCYSTSDYAVNGADPRLTVYADGSAVGVLMPGGTIELPEAPRQWRVVPVVASPTLSGTVQVGEGVLRPGTINGTVSVVDGEVLRVMQGWQGLALASRTAGAGAYSAIAMCLFNPLLTGIMRSLHVDSNSTGVTVAMWAAQVSAEPLYNARYRVRNKLLSLSSVSFPLTDAAIYGLIDSTVPGYNTPDCDPAKFSNWQKFGEFRMSTTGYQVIDGAPIVVSPGWALVLVANSPAVQLTVRADCEGVLA